MPGLTAQLLNDRGSSVTKPTYSKSAPSECIKGSFLPGMMLLRPPQQRGKRRLRQCLLSFSCLAAWSLRVFVWSAVYGDEAIEPNTSVLTSL